MLADNESSSASYAWIEVLCDICTDPATSIAILGQVLTLILRLLNEAMTIREQVTVLETRHSAGPDSEGEREHACFWVYELYRI